MYPFKLQNTERRTEVEKWTRQKDQQKWNGNEGKKKQNKRCINIFFFSLFIYNRRINFKIIEDEAAKRIELLVKRRVEEELEKRKDEIEQEVSKRVDVAKKKMERELMIELEKRREKAREEEQKREV